MKPEALVEEVHNLLARFFALTEANHEYEIRREFAFFGK
jgi:hypothetical protein